MNENITHLKKEICNLFPKLPAAKHSLSDAIIADDYGRTDNIFEEIWNGWTEITDIQVNDCPYIFSYLPIEDVLYYLPRYMIWTLDDINGDIPEEQTGISGSCLISWLIQNWQQIQSRVTPNQLFLIQKFLKFAYLDKRNYHHDFDKVDTHVLFAEKK